MYFAGSTASCFTKHMMCMFMSTPWQHKTYNTVCLGYYKVSFVKQDHNSYKLYTSQIQVPLMRTFKYISIKLTKITPADLHLSYLASLVPLKADPEQKGSCLESSLHIWGNQPQFTSFVELQIGKTNHKALKSQFQPKCAVLSE